MYNATDRHGGDLSDNIFREKNKQLMKENRKIRRQNLDLKEYIKVLETELELLKKG